MFIIRNGYKLASVYNLLGQEVSFKLIRSDLYSVDYVEGGFYYVKLIDGGGNVYQQKILIE